MYRDIVFTVRRYASTVYAVVVCLSVRLFVCLSVHLSQAGTVPKWLNLGSHKQHHTIAKGVSLSHARNLSKFQRNRPKWGRQIKVG